MPTFNEIKTQADDPTKVRKILQAVSFYAPMTVDVPENIIGPDKQLLAIPTGFFPLGIVTKDGGYEFETEVSKEPTEGFGYASSVREDITSVVRMVKTSLLESYRRAIAELIYATDLSDVVPGINGEIVFDEPPMPELNEGRLLVIGVDGSGANQFIEGRCFPRAKLNNLPSEAWKASDPKAYPLEFMVSDDDELGTSVRRYIGGSGFDGATSGWI